MLSLDFLIVTITNPPTYTAISSLKQRAVSIQHRALFFAQPSLNPSLNEPHFQTQNQLQPPPPPTRIVLALALVTISCSSRKLLLAYGITFGSMAINCLSRPWLVLVIGGWCLKISWV